MDLEKEVSTSRLCHNEAKRRCDMRFNLERVLHSNSACLIESRDSLQILSLSHPSIFVSNIVNFYPYLCFHDILVGKLIKASLGHVMCNFKLEGLFESSPVDVLCYIILFWT